MADDWAAATAAQIMILAYSSEDAREQIENILRLAKLDGELIGIVKAKRIVNETFDLPQTDGGTS